MICEVRFIFANTNKSGARKAKEGTKVKGVEKKVIRNRRSEVEVRIREEKKEEL